MVFLSFPSSKVVVLNSESAVKFGTGGACRQAAFWLRMPHAMPDATIHAVGKILEHLNPVLYRVALPNGKKILAHLSKPLTEAKAEFSSDDRVVLELTAYDFDQARILLRAE